MNDDVYVINHEENKNSIVFLFVYKFFFPFIKKKVLEFLVDFLNVKIN